MSSWPFVGAAGLSLTVGGASVVVLEMPTARIDTLGGVAAITGLVMVFAAAALWVHDSNERE